ncbi:MAG: TlpA disulfide reductase family protein [Armatimonas sp.]
MTGKSTEDKQITLSDLKGKVVLLNFWATWCNPCRQEMPEIVKLQEKYKDRGLVVVGVAADETPEPVIAFLKKNPLPYTNIYITGDIAKVYGVGAFPTSVLIDKNGQIVFDIDGYDPSLDFGKLIEKYL